MGIGKVNDDCNTAMIFLVLIVIGIIAAFVFLSPTEEERTWKIIKVQNQYQHVINKIKKCVQNSQGYDWYIRDDDFICYDAEGRMKFQDNSDFK